MTAPPIAALDTNVLVSAFCFPGSLPADLVRRCQAGEFVLLTSPSILAEMSDVLLRPKIVRRVGMTRDKAEILSRAVKRIAAIVPGAIALDAVPSDPKDNHVVACAVVGRADFIVSGDHHLKDLALYKGIRILSPAQFHGLLREAL